MATDLSYFADPDTILSASTAKYSELILAEEYYREGVWKIYYRVRGHKYVQTHTRTDQTTFEIDHGPDEIKFSGFDAGVRALALFDLMKEDKA